MNCTYCKKLATEHIIIKKSAIAEKKQSRSKVYDKKNGDGPVNRVTDEFIFKEVNAHTLHICKSCRQKHIFSTKRRAKILMTLSAILFFGIPINGIIATFFTGYSLRDFNQTYSLLIVYSSIILFIVSALKMVFADDSDEKLASSILFLALKKGILSLPPGIKTIDDTLMIPYAGYFHKKKEGDHIYMTAFEWDEIERAKYKLKIIHDDGKLYKITPKYFDFE